MKYEPDFPKQMTHPQHMPAMLVDTSRGGDNYQGRPERFPPVTVMTAEQEEDQRARGYLLAGESPPQQAHAAEYPKMLAHPLHVDGIPPKTEGRVVGGMLDPASGQMIGGHLETYVMPGVPEKYPNITVKDAEEEAEWSIKGYAPNGHWDEAALDRAQHTPGPAYVPEEWPKWIDGQIVHDPNAPTPAEKRALERKYPMMVGNHIANNAAEEQLLRSGMAVFPNADEALLRGMVPVASQAPVPPTLDPAALKREIVEELAPMLRDMIREAITPNCVVDISGKRARKPMSEEQRKEVGRRFAEGRARKRAERAAQAEA